MNQSREINLHRKRSCWCHDGTVGPAQSLNHRRLHVAVVISRLMGAFRCPRPGRKANTYIAK